MLDWGRSEYYEKWQVTLYSKLDDRQGFWFVEVEPFKLFGPELLMLESGVTLLLSRAMLFRSSLVGDGEVDDVLLVVRKRGMARKSFGSFAKFEATAYIITCTSSLAYF